MSIPPDNVLNFNIILSFATAYKGYFQKNGKNGYKKQPLSGARIHKFNEKGGNPGPKML
jgi:hypothetical protein